MASLHFFFPRFMNMAIADGPADKPAKIAGLEFPGRALFFLLGRTCFSIPARPPFTDVFLQSGNQKENLSFHMGRYGSPPLFIAVNGLDGNAKKLRHLPLCFSQLISELLKFFAGHGKSFTDNHIVVIKVRRCGSSCQVFFKMPESGASKIYTDFFVTPP